MNEVEEVTEGLMEVFRALNTGAMDAKDAQEINNTAGKIISAYKARLTYHALRGEAPRIQGLETTPSPLQAALTREPTQEEKERAIAKVRDACGGRNAA